MRAGNLDVDRRWSARRARSRARAATTSRNSGRRSIQFLQERIVGKPGVHVPKLTAEQTAAFGDYAKHMR